MSSTLANTICQQLADEIVSGELRPGQRIDEQGIATRFNVSRTPVRDALRQLAATGLAEIRPHRGAVVCDPQLQQLGEMFEALGELEALCAGFSAQRMNALERKTLQQLAQQGSEALHEEDHARYSQLNEEFHKLIYRGSHNASLEQAALNLWHQVAPYRRSSVFKRENRMSRSFDEHTEIVRDIIAGNGEAVAAAMREHVANSSINAIAQLQDGVEQQGAKATQAS